MEPEEPCYTKTYRNIKMRRPTFASNRHAGARPGHLSIIFNWPHNVQQFFVDLSENRIAECMSKLQRPKNATEASQRSRAYTFLNREGYVVRVAKDRYLINPSFIIPPGSEIFEWVDTWNRLMPQHQLKYPYQY